MRVGDKTVIRANKHLYVSQPDGSYRRLVMPIASDAMKDEFAPFFCSEAATSISIPIFEFRDATKKGNNWRDESIDLDLEESAYVWRMVELDLKTEKFTVTDCDKKNEFVKASKWIDNEMIMFDFFSIQVYRISEGRSSLHCEFELTDKKMTILKNNYRLFASSQEDYKLYICVMHHETRELFLMDKVENNKLINIGIKYRPFKQLRDNRLIFDKEDNKLLLAIEDPQRHLFSMQTSTLRLLDAPSALNRILFSYT